MLQHWQTVKIMQLWVNVYALTVSLLNFYKNWPIPASFCLFSFFSCYNFNTNWKKCRWCAWDSNLGPQDGRRRWNHWAMELILLNCIKSCYYVLLNFHFKYHIKIGSDANCGSVTIPRDNCSGNFCSFFGLNQALSAYHRFLKIKI